MTEDCDCVRLSPGPGVVLVVPGDAIRGPAKSSAFLRLICWKGLHDWHVQEQTERISSIDPAPSACQWSTSFCWRITSPSRRTP